MINRALKYTIGFAIVGIIITVLVTYIERNTLHTYEQNMPYMSLGDNIKTRSTKAHLWFEKLVAGDASLNFDRDVLKVLASSRGILQGAYDGKQTEVGSFGKNIDEETKVILKEAIVGVDKLIESAQERWKSKQQAIAMANDSTHATSSAQQAKLSDQQFDTTYKEFQTTMDRLVEHVTGNVSHDRSTLNMLSWFSVALIASAFIVLCVILYRMQHGSDKMVQQNTALLERQSKGAASVSGFIEAISAGNYSLDLQMEDDNNFKGILINMRDKLRNNAEEDRKRNWSTSGLAQIGEILRATTKTTEELYDNIIRFVVKYTKSNQGGLFILNEDSETEKHLELVACYAFERKKYLNKTVSIGEGLIGQCFLEGERIYLLQLPQEYVSITSGLGGSTPNALLIIPLKVNEQIYGVLEIATFSKYDEFEIEMVEKLAESIASTISTVRINESTRILLERTQQQAEEMRAQEEEMRQNMEELEATQEEMRRKEKHVQNMLDTEKQRNEFSNKNRQVVMELTKNKDLQAGHWDKALEKITSAVGRQLAVSRCSLWMYEAKEDKIVCEKLYLSDRGTYEKGAVIYGKDYPGYLNIVKREETLIAKDVNDHPDTLALAEGLLASSGIQSMLSVPFFNEGKVAGVIMCEHQGTHKEWTDDHVEFLKSCADLISVTYNTSKINTMVANLSDAQETMQTIIDTIPRAVFWKDKDLRFQGCNTIFSTVAGVASPRDIIGRTDFDMPWKEHAETYRADDLAVMNSKKGRLDHEERNVGSNGQESWVLTSKVPVMNKQGEVVAVLGMFEDITERKRKETDITAKLKELETLKAGK